MSTKLASLAVLFFLSVAVAAEGSANIHQPTGITYTQSGAPIGDLEYTYDSGGRVATMGGSLAHINLPQPVSGLTYNADNQLTQYSTSQLVYDNNGNLTSDGTHTYAWDARNHLAAIDGGSTASFVYDPFGRRIAKSVYGVSTGFLYDGSNVVQELSGTTPSANLLTKTWGQTGRSPRPRAKPSHFSSSGRIYNSFIF